MKADKTNQQPQPVKRYACEPIGRSYAHKGRMTCPNCGADMGVEDARCPYCGELNPLGAERAYMEELDDLRDDTDDLAEDTKNDFKASLRQNAKKTVAIIIAAIAVLATLFFAANCMSKSEERQAMQSYQAREAFRARYFEEFDRLYEAGDDDALSEYVWSLLDDPGFDALSSWEHAGYLEVHDGWQALRSTANEIESGNLGLDDYAWSVTLAIRLAKLDDHDRSPTASLSAEEEKRAAGYRAYARQFLRNVLQMNDDELAAFTKAAQDAKGYIQDEKLKHNLEERLKQLGTLR